jgi:hypothetical protein
MAFCPLPVDFQPAANAGDPADSAKPPKCCYALRVGAHSAGCRALIGSGDRSPRFSPKSFLSVSALWFLPVCLSVTISV